MKFHEKLCRSNVSLFLAIILVGATFVTESSRADEFDSFMDGAAKTKSVSEPAEDISVAPKGGDEFTAPVVKSGKKPAVKAKKLADRKVQVDRIKPEGAPNASKPSPKMNSDLNSNSKSQPRYIPLPEEDPVVIDSGVPYYFE